MSKTIHLLAFLCFFTLISNAQTRDANITITVRDQFDSVISDAEITLFKSDSKEKQTKTNRQGIAQLTGVAIGEYYLSVSAPGFKEYKSELLSVKNSQTQRLDIILEVAPVESNVEITGDEAIEPETAGAATVLNEKDLANLPDDQQEFERMLKRIGESVAGEELPITVNGIQGAKIPPKQMIQQVRVNQNVFSAQYDSPFGGGIEIFTRTSVTKFSGGVGFNFADSRFNAADPFLGRRLPFQSRGYSFDLTGPLGKRASFNIWANHAETDSSAVINAVTLNSNLQPVNFKESFATPNRINTIYGTINADLTKKHKLYLSYSLWANRGKGQNVGGFSLPSRANDSDSQDHYLQFSDTYLANENIVNLTRFSSSYSTYKNFGGNNEVAINVLDAFFGGGSQQENTNKNFRFDAANETTWQMGKYALGFGWRIRGEHINQVSRSNFGGTYTFSGRLAPVLDANNNPVIDGAGNIVTDQISSLESYRRTLLFQQLGYSRQRIRELGGGANQFTISGGNPKITASQYDFGLYFQNSYKLTETIAASFGVRYENQTNIDSGLNFAPRVGIIWAPKAKPKEKPLFSLPRVSIGYGMFYTRFPLASTVNILQANDPDRAQYLITEANILNLYPGVPTVDLLEQFALPRTQRFLDDQLATPYQSLLNITAAKKMPKGYTLNFTFSHGTNFRRAFTQNINAPLAGTFNPLNPAASIRPFGNVGNIYETQSIGRSKTTKFSVNLNFPQSPKLYGFLRYEFSKSKSNIVSGTGSPFDPYDFSQEFAPDILDGVHRFSNYLSYQLPYKFTIGLDSRISSGTRFNIFTGRDSNGDGYFSERPSFATDLNKPNLVATKYGILDPNPAPGAQLIPRNLGRGPVNITSNLFIGKTFGFGEDKANKKPPKRTLRFNMSISNVFNIINKGNPVGNMSSPNFLQSLTGFSDGSIIIINGARQNEVIGRSMNFGVRFGF